MDELICMIVTSVPAEIVVSRMLISFSYITGIAIQSLRCVTVYLFNTTPHVNGEVDHLIQHQHFSRKCPGFLVKKIICNTD